MRVQASGFPAKRVMAIRYWAALVQAAHALTHTKTYLAAQFWRLTRRRGKASGSVAHSILVIAYHLLQRQEPYRDLGSQLLRPTATRGN